jgi:hypothetical protein
VFGFGVVGVLPYSVGCYRHTQLPPLFFRLLAFACAVVGLVGQFACMLVAFGWLGSVAWFGLLVALGWLASVTLF